MSISCISESEHGAILQVLAVPRSSRTEITGIQENRCKIKVKAPPVDGEANAAICKALAKYFGLPKSSIVQQKGQTGKQKTFLLAGINMSEAEEILEKILSEL